MRNGMEKTCKNALIIVPRMISKSSTERSGGTELWCFFWIWPHFEFFNIHVDCRSHKDSRFPQSRPCWVISRWHWWNLRWGGRRHRFFATHVAIFAQRFEDVVARFCSLILRQSQRHCAQSPAWSACCRNRWFAVEFPFQPVASRQASSYLDSNARASDSNRQFLPSVQNAPRPVRWALCFAATQPHSRYIQVCCFLCHHSIFFDESIQFSCSAIRLPLIRHTTPNIVVEPEWRLAVTLRYLAGARVTDLANVAPLAFTSIYKTIWSTIRVINECEGLTMRFDTSHEACRERSAAFRRRSSAPDSFSSCVGAVDGLFIRTERPSLSEHPKPSCFYNGHKQGFGVNMQAVCDSFCRILEFSINTPGKWCCLWSSVGWLIDWCFFSHSLARCFSSSCVIEWSLFIVISSRLHEWLRCVQHERSQRAFWEATSRIFRCWGSCVPSLKPPHHFVHRRQSAEQSREKRWLQFFSLSNSVGFRCCLRLSYNYGFNNFWIIYWYFI